MHASLVIARKDLRQRLRDRSAILIAFVAPIALASIISGAFGGGTAPTFDATVAVVDADSTDLSRAFTERVLGSPDLRRLLTVKPVSSVDEARAMIDDGRAKAAFAIPAGFTDAVTTGGDARMQVLTSAAFPITASVTEAIATGFTDQLNAARLSIGTAIAAGSQLPLTELVARARNTRLPTRVTEGTVGSRQVKTAAYFGPAMAMFFVFFTLSFAARGLIAERSQGTLGRLLATPASRGAVLVGKALPALALGLASFGVMYVVMGLVFRVSWGNPIAIAALSVATVFAVFGITAIVQVASRSEQQAQTASQVVTAALALLGGNFFPLFQMPDAMQRIAMLTPNAWAMRGFSDVAFDGAGLAGVLPSLVVLLAVGLVASAFAGVRARSLVTA